MTGPLAAHVVAIDDAAELLDVYRDLFEDEGYRVSTLTDCAVDPSTVLCLAPDLIVLDLRCCDGLSGLDLLRRLRDDPDGATVPIIISTALLPSALSDHEAELLALGAAVVRKPFSIDDLLRQVEQVVDRARDARQRSDAARDRLSRVVCRHRATMDGRTAD